MERLELVERTDGVNPGNSSRPGLSLSQARDCRIPVHRGSGWPFNDTEVDVELFAATHFVDCRAHVVLDATSINDAKDTELLTLTNPVGLNAHMAAQHAVISQTNSSHGWVKDALPLLARDRTESGVGSP